MYKGVTLDCGLHVKNGSVETEIDWDEIRKNQQQLIQRINAGPQPARITRERAFEELKAKRRR